MKIDSQQESAWPIPNRSRVSLVLLSDFEESTSANTTDVLSRTSELPKIRK